MSVWCRCSIKDIKSNAETACPTMEAYCTFTDAVEDGEQPCEGCQYAFYPHASGSLYCSLSAYHTLFMLRLAGGH